MLNTNKLWTLAAAEMRSCRRLFRTWIVISVALLVCISWYWRMLENAEWPFPPWSFADDSMTARYTISTMMNAFVAIFSIGMIVLSFDIRVRDIRHHMSDVVDSLPASNFEILSGRLVGVFIVLLIPCIIFLALITSYEIVAELVGTRFQLGLRPLSVLSLISWNLIPNLIFFSALVACLASLVRFRLLVAIIALGVLYGFNWIESYIPVRFQESLSQFSGSALVPSDLAPVFVTPAIIGNKCAILLVSFALFLFAARMYPRVDQLRTRTTIFGFVASALAVFTFFGLITAVLAMENHKEQWLSEHRSLNPTAFPDVQHLKGTVVLHPGRKINLDVTLTVHLPTMNTTDSVIFSLNPGYKIQQLYVDGERTSDYSFSAGILKLSTDLLPKMSHDVRVQAVGKPDDRFAYLDQARDFRKFPNRSAQQLGLKNSIFHRDFVALMPGVFWYPTSGSAVDKDVPELQPRDLFTTDLEISAPRNWHVATVGKREVTENEKGITYQFKSEAPIPEIALLASEFDRRTTTIESVEFEVLFSKKHLQNLDALSSLTEIIDQWVAERIHNAHASSLSYPYTVFSVVEVPSNLRIYAGGWRMDSVLQPPGLMLVRETNFPTERFENVVVRERSREWRSKAEQDEQVFKVLYEYFRDDGHGGSPFVGFARNFVSHQVSATGRGATVLQYLLDQLSNQLTTKTDSFSVISLAEFGKSIPGGGYERTPDDDPNSWAFQTRSRVATAPSTWEVMNRTALFDLDFKSNPIPSYRTLLAKGRALARSMIDYYGSDKIGEFLDQLVRKYRAQSFTKTEFLDTAAEVGLDFNEWLHPWFENTTLPGYLTTTPSVLKLEEQAEDITNYQTTFVLYNAEPMAGFVRVFWEDHEVDERNPRWPSGEYFNSDPLLLAGHGAKRIAISSVHPLGGIWIEPYLAHNRSVFEVLVPPAAEKIVPEIPVLPVATDIEWLPPKSDVVVVDDLDPNFSVVKRTAGSQSIAVLETVLQSSKIQREYDQGLLVSNAPRFGMWTRMYSTSGYGLYRRTFAPIAQGDETSAARFVANLPYDGHWNLEIYIPKDAFSGRYYGGYIDFFGIKYDDNRFVTRNANPDAPDEYYRLVIKNGNADREEKFDIANATEGWNEVGLFEFSSTDVEVLLSAWAGHEEITVYADAIRWTPVPGDNINVKP